jgi:hypothetical protein
MPFKPSLIPPLQRFLAKCSFDPTTGCVNWTGAKTAGRGHHAQYGAFKCPFLKKKVYAHRWAAQHIHLLDITDKQVDHMCQNTLCQHHLQAIPAMQNRELQWIRYQVGLDELPDWKEHDSVLTAPVDADGFYFEPAWLSFTDLPSSIQQPLPCHSDLDYLQQVPF